MTSEWDIIGAALAIEREARYTQPAPARVAVDTEDTAWIAQHSQGTIPSGSGGRVLHLADLPAVRITSINGRQFHTWAWGGDAGRPSDHKFDTVGMSAVDIAGHTARIAAARIAAGFNA